MKDTSQCNPTGRHNDCPGISGPIVDIVKKLEKAVDEAADAALRAAIEAQIEAESLPTFLSGMLYDDGVIDPRDTRTVLGMCLSAIASGPIEGTPNFGVFRM